MKKAYIFKTMLLGLSLGMLSSCGEDLNKADYDYNLPTPALPTVTTGNVEVFGTAIKAGFTITNPEGLQVDNQGLLVGTTPDLALADSTTQVVQISNATSGQEAVTAVTGLTEGTTYYIKAFAYAQGGVTYGETKSFEAAGGYERVVDYATDFSDMNGTDIDDFTTVKLGNTVNPFTPVSLQNLDLPQWGFSSSIFDPSLFSTMNGVIGSYDENNLLSFKADLTGKGFSSVSVEGLNIGTLFGTDYAGVPGNFDVYVSTEPITSEAELATATKLGTCAFATDPTAATYQFCTITADIPIEFDGECYITIHNHSIYANDGNFGVVITDFRLSSLHQVAE